MASDAELSSMKDEDVFAFIFKPGFSTAAQVNVFSGRGVGLDSVQMAIEGRRHHQSRIGQGQRLPFHD